MKLTASVVWRDEKRYSVRVIPGPPLIQAGLNGIPSVLADATHGNPMFARRAVLFGLNNDAVGRVAVKAVCAQCGPA